LLIAMASFSLSVFVAVSVYQHTLERTKENLLKNNLFTLRTVVDEYTFDKHAVPRKVQDLVTEGYLRSVPVDPFTGKELRMEDLRR